LTGEQGEFSNLQSLETVTTDIQIDTIYCGGSCSATGSSLASIPAGVGAAFPNASKFEAYIHPNTGHGINFHYNGKLSVSDARTLKSAWGEDANVFCSHWRLRRYPELLLFQRSSKLIKQIQHSLRLLNYTFVPWPDKATEHFMMYYV
jgi:hypothetical protein